MMTNDGTVSSLSNTIPMMTPSQQTRSYRRRSVPQRQQRRHQSTRPMSCEERPSNVQTLRNNVSQLNPIHLPTTLDTGWVIQTALSTLVHHLLFVRGLFPVPVVELQKETTTSNGVVALSSMSSRRKIQQAKRQLQNFADSLTSESSSTLIRQASFVLITLGPSVSRGQEFYVLDVRNLGCASRKCWKPSPAPAAAPALARRLIPRIMESNWDLPSSNASSLKLFVSVLLPKDKMEEHWQDHCGQDPSSQSTSLRHWIPQSGRLLPKTDEVQSPIVRGKRKKQLMLIPLGHDPQNGNESTWNSFNKLHNLLDREQGVTEDGQWLCFSQGIKGFRI